MLALLLTKFDDCHTTRCEQQCISAINKIKLLCYTVTITRGVEF